MGGFVLYMLMGEQGVAEDTVSFTASLLHCLSGEKARSWLRLAQENVVKVFESHVGHMWLSPHLYIAVLTLS